MTLHTIRQGVVERDPHAEKDVRVPDGAPWEITDTTPNMYELTFYYRPGVPVMVYWWTYEALCYEFVHGRIPRE